MPPRRAGLDAYFRLCSAEYWCQLRAACSSRVRSIWAIDSRFCAAAAPLPPIRGRYETAEQAGLVGDDADLTYFKDYAKWIMLEKLNHTDAVEAHPDALISWHLNL